MVIGKYVPCRKILSTLGSNKYGDQKNMRIGGIVVVTRPKVPVQTSIVATKLKMQRQPTFPEAGNSPV